ncbi:cytochrome c oxidase assembly protein [Nesterenkonia xinjiangensis]|uniref:Putative copper resistance protein D n=1 Tax=Nesterenkonia xinjiangensis TaxID=225327 RepID=A0A7Z0GMH1_9MICC|nr:cytochrome c oxidase assembly protein [Nesterenkonia xinjiangensis]NYJ78625.1 putative copper resistance protein D [Nesterenkonia xinjiangensis]
MTPAAGGRDAARSTADAPVRAVSLPAVGAALCLGLVAVAVAGLLTGIGRPSQIADPGVVTRWGLPVARFIHHVAMATAIGGVILAVMAVPSRVGPRSRQRRAEKRRADRAGRSGASTVITHPLYACTLQIAGVAAVVWTVAAVAVLVLTYSALAGQPLSSDDGFSAGFLGYVQSIPTGQAWMTVVLIAAVFATLVFAVRAPAGLFFVAVLGLSGIIPMALVGHSASGQDHMAAVNSLALHLLGVVVWVGGLVVLALLSPEIRRQATELTAREQGGPEIVGTLLRRYSVLAGLAIATVAASGIINADLRIATLDQLLTTPYGIMLALKFGATVGLAIIGWMHRSWIIPRLAGAHEGAGAGASSGASPDPTRSRAVTGLLWQLILVEIAIMSAVIGVSAVLGRTSPPVSEDQPSDATPARILTGYDLPPEPTVGLWFSQWRFDWLWVAVVVFLAAWYLHSMVKLRRRGDTWSIMRAVSFLFGLTVLLWVTSGGPAIYGMVLFSGHMIQHMTLTMVAPMFLVLGSPVTLALRSLSPRTDGTRGAREWILWLVHSRFSRVVTHPVVAAVNFAGSLVLFYYTPLFGLALEYHLGHELMNIHFLLTGYIFALVMVGHDPLPKRPAHAIRLVILLATMAFHAFIAVALSGAESLIQASWFGNIGHDWGFSALDDQQRGGELMWGLGEIPTMLLAVIAAVQWSREDRREMVREDREADRTGDAGLHEYNEMFARMAERDDPR